MQQTLRTGGRCDDPAVSTRPAHTLTVSIDRDPATVHAFVRDGHTLPAWAPGFARDVDRDGDGWVVTTGSGEVRVTFVEDNPFGVLDHHVTAPGLDVVVPMRVIANGDGCEVLFPVVEPPGADGGEVARDLALVRSDLARLKSVLEGSSPRPAAG